MMMPKIFDKVNPAAYQFFREQGFGASKAIAYARDEQKAEDLKIDILWQDEDDSWDGESPAPKYLLWGVIVHMKDIDDRRCAPRLGAEILASLGMVGVDSLRDPYLRICAVELCREAFHVLDKENAKIAENDYAHRATFAG